MINQVFMNLLVNACQSIDLKQKEGIIEIGKICGRHPFLWQSEILLQVSI